MLECLCQRQYQRQDKIQLHSKMSLCLYHREDGEVEDCTGIRPDEEASDKGVEGVPFFPWWK